MATTEEIQKEQDEEARLEAVGLDAKMRQQSNVMSSMGKSLAETAPQLVDKLVNPKIIPDSPYHGIIPSLNFGNYTEDATGLISTHYAQLLFMYMKASRAGWLTDDLALDTAGRWTVDVEESKGRGAERISKLFFSETSQITLKREKPKPFEGK